MSQSDTTDLLLVPIDDSTPVGPNCEYGPVSTEFEQIPMPPPERAIGDSLRARRESDWEKVENAVEALLVHTRELRVAVHLTAAQTRRRAVAGWAAGLGLVRGLTAQYWDDVRPRLDADADLSDHERGHRSHRAAVQEPGPHARRGRPCKGATRAAAQSIPTRAARPPRSDSVVPLCGAMLARIVTLQLSQVKRGVEERYRVLSIMTTR